MEQICSYRLEGYFFSYFKNYVALTIQREPSQKGFSSFPLWIAIQYNAPFTNERGELNAIAVWKFKALNILPHSIE